MMILKRIILMLDNLEYNIQAPHYFIMRHFFVCGKEIIENDQFIIFLVLK